MRVQRVVMPGSGLESWTVLGQDQVPLEPVERFLSYLASVERSPNTVKAYAHDLKDRFTFLARQGLDWRSATVEDVAGFVGWLRLPCRPSPCGRLSRPRSTTTAPPRTRPSAGNAPIPTCPAGLAGTQGPRRARFPRSLRFDRRAWRPALPLRPRHSYAVDLHRDLPDQAGETRPEVPPAIDHRPRCAPLTSPHPPGWSWRHLKRLYDTGSSRTPSRLAHRARPIRQC